LFFNPENALVVFTAELVGILFVITALLGKYAYFPSEINIIPGFTIAISIFFPPFLLVSLPYFYFKAVKNLKIAVQ